MWKKIVGAVLVCMSLTACETMNVSSGPDKFSTAALKENIKVGVSTPQDIRAIYGTPDYEVETNGIPSTWSYNVDQDKNSLIDVASSFIPVYGASTAAGQVKRHRYLFVMFRNNVVTDYSISESRPR